MTRKAVQSEAKALQKRLREERDAEEAEKKEFREAKRRRRAENMVKSAQGQVVADPAKLKKMNKKQLRNLKKTRVNKDGVVELVPAYG